MASRTPFTRMDRQALAMLAEDIADRIGDSADYPMFDEISSADWQRVLPAALRELGIPVQLDAIRPADVPRAKYPCLDKGVPGRADDTSDVPPLVYEVADQRAEAYQRANGGFYPPVPFDAGANAERAGVGLPGHCSVCAILGHIVAHPEFGCSDVGCDSDHTGPGQITRHTCTPDGKALPYGRKAPIGTCLRCDQLRAGAQAREAHPAIQAANRRRDDEAQTTAAMKEHFAPNGPHARGECGPVCTKFDN